METNVSFKSNVNIIKSKSTLKGDEEFLKKVTDYYALYKLMMGPCGGSTNSSYYVFKVSQRKIFEINANTIELLGAGAPVVAPVSSSNSDITKFDQEEFADELIGEDEIPF